MQQQPAIPQRLSAVNDAVSPPPWPAEGFRVPDLLAGAIPPYRLAVLQLISLTTPTRFIELGCHLSETSLAVLDTFPRCDVLAVDWFRPATNGSDYHRTGDKYAAIDSESCDKILWHSRLALKRHEFRAVLLNASIMRAASYQPENSADAVFLDAGYDCSSVTVHLAAWWPIVRRGGVLFGREWDASQPPPSAAVPGCRVAVEQFVRQVGSCSVGYGERAMLQWFQSDDGNRFWWLSKGLVGVRKRVVGWAGRGWLRSR